MDDLHPKVFLSYSHTSDSHKLKVKEFGQKLISNGIEVIADFWDLKLGHDVIYFMEQLLNDDSIKNVLIISDKRYSDKANQRNGGVGIEVQILSPQVYNNCKQEKIIPIVFERQDNKVCLPTYLTGRNYIDYVDDDKKEEEFQKLIKFLHTGTIDDKPKLGTSPNYNRDNVKKTGLYYFNSQLKSEYSKYDDLRELLKLSLRKNNGSYINDYKTLERWCLQNKDILVDIVHSFDGTWLLSPDFNLIEDLNDKNKIKIDKFVLSFFQRYKSIINWIYNIFSTNGKTEFLGVIDTFYKVSIPIFNDIDLFIKNMMEDQKALLENVNIEKDGPAFVMRSTLHFSGFEFEKIVDELSKLT